MRSLTSVATAVALAGVADAQVQFTLVTTIDLDRTAVPTNAEFVGSNPSAVAWDGTDLYVAGFNSSGLTADVAIVRIADALNVPTFGARFASLSTPNLRGYSGLDIAGAGVAAAYDDGAADPNGITVYDGAAGTLVWAKNGRGGSGVGFDPGFPMGTPALGSGVGWTAFGSGRRALQDSATGADIWTSANGMIVNGAGTGTFWRDMDFEDATGNIWLREGNNVIACDRSGDNAVTNTRLVVDAVEADSVNGQNIAVLQGGSQDFVIWNDRSITNTGQAFTSVVKANRTSGAAVTIDWGTFTAAAGSGYYDFSWDSASQTLALLDFANRDVHVFRMTTPIGTAYCTATANSSGLPGTIAAFGSPFVVDNDVTLVAQQLPANAFSFFLASTTQDFVAAHMGSAGNLCLGGAIGRGVGGQIYATGATGAIEAVADLTAMPTPMGSVAVLAGETWNFQAWTRDAVGGVATSNFTNGVAIAFQ